MEVESEKSKRIAKNTLYLYLRMFLTLFVSLYTVRVVLRVLSITDYGVYGAVGGVVASLSFITSTLACASQRYFSYEIGKGRDGKIKEVFSSIFVLYLVASFIVIILAEIIGVWFLVNKMQIPPHRLNAAMWVFHFALGSFVISLIANPYQAIVIAKERMHLYAYISIIDVALKLMIVYLLLVIEFDKLKVYAVLLFLSSIITNSIYFIYCFRKFPETHTNLKVNFKIVKSIIGYSIWTLLGTLAGMCNTQGLNVILNLFFGPIANAAYLIASQVSSHSSLFANNFYTAISPSIIKSYAANDYETVNKYCLFSTKIIFILMAILILPLLINTEEILKLWLGEVGQYMVIFVQLSLIYALVLSLSNPITTVVQAQGNVKLYHGLVDGFGLIALPATYLCFKQGLEAYWGYLSMIIIFTISHVIRIYVIKTVFPVFDSFKYLQKAILPILITSILSYGIMIPIKNHYNSSFLDVVINSIVAAFIIFTLSFIVIITKQERTSLFKIILKKN